MRPTGAQEPVRVDSSWKDSERWVYQTDNYKYEVIVINDSPSKVSTSGEVMLSITSLEAETVGLPEETRTWAEMALGNNGGIVTPGLIETVFHDGLFAGLDRRSHGNVMDVAWIVASATHRPLAVVSKETDDLPSP